MGTVLTILGLINSLQTMKDDKLSGGMQLFGTLGNSGWFGNNAKPFQYHSFGETDAGVRRNYQ